MTGDYDSAIQQFEKTREMAPNFFSAHAWLSLIYSQTGDTDAALRAAEKTAELNDTMGILSFARLYAMGD